MAKINGTTAKNGYGFYAILTETLGENYLSENASTVEYEVYIVNGNKRTDSSDWTFNAKIDGSNVYNKISQKLKTDDTGYNTAKKLFSGSEVIKHNNDGKKTITFSATLTKSSYGSYDPGKCSLSGTFDLTTIPRASTLSVSNSLPYIGDNITIAISKKNENYTHQLSWKTEDNKANGTIEIVETEKSVIWTIPEILYDLIPDNDRIKILLLLNTYNGEAQIGATYQYDITCVVNPEKNKPVVSYTMTETNEKVSAITDKLVLNASKPNFKITSSGKNGATIKSVVVTNGDGQSYSGEEVTFKEIGKNNFTINVTDSRGIPNILNFEKDAIDYIQPNIKAVEVVRKSPTSGEIIVNANGSFFNKNIKTTPNEIDIKYRFKQNVNSATWSDLATIPKDAFTYNDSDNSYSIVDYNLGNITLYNKNYIFEFYYNDLLISSTTPSTREVLKGVTTFDYGEHDFQVNGDLFVADEDRKNKVNILEAIGILANLTTDGKTSLVNAINEINEKTSANIMTIGLTDNKTFTISKAWAYTKLVCDTLQLKLGNKLTFENGAIKIGEGVKYVKISANAMTNGIANYQIVNIALNGTYKATGYYRSTNASYYGTIGLSPVVIEVAAGDEISLTYGAGATGSLVIAGGTTTYLTVEVIE